MIQAKSWTSFLPSYTVQNSAILPVLQGLSPALLRVLSLLANLALCATSVHDARTVSSFASELLLPGDCTCYATGVHFAGTVSSFASALLLPVLPGHLTCYATSIHAAGTVSSVASELLLLDAPTCCATGVHDAGTVSRDLTCCATGIHDAGSILCFGGSRL